MDKKLERAKRCFEQAKDDNSEQHSRMLEDMEFSNPANPQQWDIQTISERKLARRPYFTFDYTNQYIMQVVNDQRMNKPGVKVIPVGSDGDMKVAKVLEGLFRHIEYASRAGITYDTAIEQAARTGMGWIRVVTEVVDPETNEQEIRIKRVLDPRAVMINGSEPDGSDATEGHVETVMTSADFKRQYPNAKKNKDDKSGWYSGDEVRVCEFFEVVITKKNRIIIETQEGRTTLGEDEYWEMVKTIGFQPKVVGNYMAEVKTVEWMKYCGEDILEESTFPSPYIPLIPVLGYEIWIEAQRYVCGMPRRMRDAQMAINVAKTAEAEMIMKSPKQPWIVSAPSVANYKQFWENADGNAPYLPWDPYDSELRQQPKPERLAPAQPSAGYLQMVQAGKEDLEASIGMYRANLGMSSNETSGKAINARQRQGSIANYHYVDNMARSIEHMGRVILSMIPVVYDTKRVIQTLGEDGSPDTMTLDPEQLDPALVKASQTVAINPNIGRYDVQVKVGPGYATLRQESAEMLTQVMQNPAMAPIVGPIWAKMQDWPEADKIYRMLLSVAPPQVQEAAAEEGDDQIPPQIAMKFKQMQQQGQQAEQVIQQLMQKLQEAEQGHQASMAEAQQKIQAENERHSMTIKANAATDMAKIESANQKTDSDNQTKLIVEQMRTENSKAIADLTQVVNLLIAHIQPPPELANEVSEDLTEED